MKHALVFLALAAQLGLAHSAQAVEVDNKVDGAWRLQERHCLKGIRKDHKEFKADDFATFFIDVAAGKAFMNFKLMMCQASYGFDLKMGESTLQFSNGKLLKHANCSSEIPKEQNNVEFSSRRLASGEMALVIPVPAGVECTENGIAEYTLTRIPVN